MATWHWKREELVLLVDLLAHRDWRAVRAGEPDAEKLSSVLKALTLHPTAGRPSTFRSPNSVQRKAYDIITGVKGYTGASTKGAPAEEQAVVAAFRADPYRLHQQAAALRSAGGDRTWGASCPERRA